MINFGVAFLGMFFVLTAFVFIECDLHADEKSDWSASSSEANRLVNTYLPANSQHVFEAPNDSWETRVSYWNRAEGSKILQPKGAILHVMNLGGTSFVEVANPTEKEKKKLYLETSYFRKDMPQNEDRPEKTFSYYPEGTPFVDLDHVGNRVYCREFFPDGVLRDYTYCQNSKWIAGIAVDPITKKPTYFSGGEGSLTTYAMDGGSHQTTWYHRGDVILVDKYTGVKRSEVDLDINNDSLQITMGKEELILSSQSEIWRRPAGSDPQFDYIYTGGPGVFLPKNRDVRSIPPMGGPREGQKRELDQILKEWKIIYPKRRKAFLDGFDQILSTSGQTWKSLNIEFIRDDDPWPRP